MSAGELCTMYWIYAFVQAIVFARFVETERLKKPRAFLISLMTAPLMTLIALSVMLAYGIAWLIGMNSDTL